MQLCPAESIPTDFPVATAEKQSYLGPEKEREGEVQKCQLHTSRDMSSSG